MKIDSDYRLKGDSILDDPLVNSSNCHVPCFCGFCEPGEYYQCEGCLRGCACLQKEWAIKGQVKHGHTKGVRNSKEYKAWRNLKDRCLNPNNKHYQDYAGRGITVCDEWHDSFEQFYADMGDAPGPDYSIDRKDNDLGYSKDNCRWVSDKSGIQSINRRIQKNNKSGYKGVSWSSTNKGWLASIKVKGKTKNLGTFNTPEEAYKVFCEAHLKYKDCLPVS